MAQRSYHILYVLHSLGRGGTENGVVNLLNRMDPQRFRFTIALMEKNRAMLERVERPGVSVVTVRRRWGNDPLYPASLYALFRREKPDLVHTRNFSCIEGLAAARLAGIKAVLHSEHGRDVTEADGLKRRRAFARSILFRCADRVVTVSEELRSTILANVKVVPEKVQCLPNGVDLSRFAPRGARERIRREFGLGADELVIGSVGRHDPVKDYRSLLLAFAAFPDISRLRLLLCGDGPQNLELRELARDLGVAERVLFTGFRDDIPDVLTSFDLFVLPSVTEGMSNAILEAMASGLPCVATRVGGNGELVSHGVNGLLVPPASPEKLHDAVRYLVEDRDARLRMGRAGRTRAETRFSLQGMVARYEDLYEGLISGGRRHIPSVTPVTRRQVVRPAPVAEPEVVEVA
jgi:sugar transferase (PEP-CTERM/EpsH1 system associated)